MTDRELQALLKSNPELTIVDDGTRTVIGPIRDNGDRTTIHVNGVAKLSEHDMQKAIIEECALRAVANPAYELIFAIPNGGHRLKHIGGMMKAEGVKRGVPDLMIPVARHSRIGLAIELKVKPNDLDEYQRWWQRRLRVEGWVCEVVYDDPQLAIDLIHWYLEK